MNLVCFGYDPWSALWKRNQMLVSVLARLTWIDEVLFVNPGAWLASICTPDVLMGRTGTCWRSLFPRRVAPNIHVYTPLILPWPRKLAWSRSLGGDLFRRALARFVSAPYALLLNDPRVPLNWDIGEVFANAASTIFDWSDDFAEFSSAPSQRETTRTLSEAMARECSLVVAVNDHLWRRASLLNTNAHVIGNATDPAHFAASMSETISIPGWLRGVPRPIIGYTGSLGTARLDQELIAHVAQRRPNWSFVFVGPRADADPLGVAARRCANVRLFPAVSYARLPSVLKGFDVCVVPHKINAYTQANDPIKLYDYLATGKPIVATRTAGTEALGDLVRTANGPDEFVEQLDRALRKDTEGARERRLRRAAEHSWQQAGERLGALIAQTVRTSGARIRRTTRAGVS